jgi:RES domain-containing protein
MAGLHVRRARPIDRALLSAFRGTAYCHVPADEPLRLDRLVTSDGTDDRWNRAGEPTLYLALDLAVAVAELARHVELAAGVPPWRRRLVGLAVEVERLVDLRRPDVRSALGIDEELVAFRDVGVARDVASRLREDEACAGLIVPSMAFLDDEARGNLVVFVDRFAGGIGELVRGTSDAGVVELRPPADRT